MLNARQDSIFSTLVKKRKTINIDLKNERGMKTMGDYMEKIKSIPADSFTEAMKEHYGNDDEIFAMINRKTDERAERRMRAEQESEDFDTQAFAVKFLRYFGVFCILLCIAAFAALGKPFLAVIPSAAFIAVFVSIAVDSNAKRRGWR